MQWLTRECYPQRSISSLASAKEGEFVSRVTDRYDYAVDVSYLFYIQLAHPVYWFACICIAYHWSWTRCRSGHCHGPSDRPGAVQGTGTCIVKLRRNVLYRSYTSSCLPTLWRGGSPRHCIRLGCATHPHTCSVLRPLILNSQLACSYIHLLVIFPRIETAWTNIAMIIALLVSRYTTFKTRSRWPSRAWPSFALRPWAQTSTHPSWTLSFTIRKCSTLARRRPSPCADSTSSAQVRSYAHLVE